MAGTTDIIISYHIGCFRLDDFRSVGRANMIISQTPHSAEERKRWHDLRSLAASTKRW